MNLILKIQKKNNSKQIEYSYTKEKYKHDLMTVNQYWDRVKILIIDTNSTYNEKAAKKVLKRNGIIDVKYVHTEDIKQTFEHYNIRYYINSDLELSKELHQINKDLDIILFANIPFSKNKELSKMKITAFDNWLYIFNLLSIMIVATLYVDEEGNDIDEKTILEKTKS